MFRLFRRRVPPYCCAMIALLALPMPGQQLASRSASLDLRHGVPLVRVMVNGRGPFRFVVDTGTNNEAVISPGLEQKIGLAADGRMRLTDLGGEQDSVLEKVTLDLLTVAGAEFHAVPALVNQLPGSDRVYDGILGFKLFRDSLLTLDFPHKKLLLGGGSLTASGDPGVLPFEMPKGIPMVALKINGQSADAAVDSGGLGLSLPESALVNLSFTGSLELLAKGQTQVSSFLVRGGAMRGEIDLAGYRFENPFVEINSAIPVAGLGSVALHDFAVTFDQRKNLIRFASNRTVHLLGRPANQQDVLQLPGDVVSNTVMRSGARQP